AARPRRFGVRASGLRSGLSLHRLPEHPGLRCCPSSLYTFPERLFRAWLGIAISGFPEFGQFCIAGFPGEHSSFLKSVASAGSATPAWLIMYSFYQRAAERTPQSCFKVFGGFFFFGFG